MSEAYAQYVWDIETNALFVKTAAGVLIPATPPPALDPKHDRPRVQKRLFADDQPVAFWCYNVEYRVQSWMVGINNGAPTWGKWNLVLKSSNDVARFRRKKAAEAYLRNMTKSPGHEYRVVPHYLAKSWGDWLKPVLRARREQQHARRVQKLRDAGEFDKANELIQKWEEAQNPWHQKATTISPLVNTMKAYYGKSALSNLKANTPFKHQGVIGPIHPKSYEALKADADWVAQKAVDSYAKGFSAYSKPTEATYTVLEPPKLTEEQMKVLVEGAAVAMAKTLGDGVEKAWKAVEAGEMVVSVHDEYIVELPDKV